MVKLKSRSGLAAWLSTRFRSTPSLDPLQKLKRTRPRWLLDTRTIKLIEFPSDDLVPPYAILSHRWEEGQEISHEEMVQCRSGLTTSLSLSSKSGFEKMVAACTEAREHNHAYIWIDTCCINKGDHGQQSQDINSMFDYYKNSEVCYVYLYDYHYGAGPLQSSWFSRGWTLQELLAPSSVEFFDATWKYCGDRETLSTSMRHITGIGEDVLRLGYGRYMARVGIVERISWAIHRETTKEEDRAYCLLGLLGVTLEPCYGEGEESAFERLLNVLEERYYYYVVHLQLGRFSSVEYDGNMYMVEELFQLLRLKRMIKWVDEEVWAQINILASRLAYYSCFSPGNRLLLLHNLYPPPFSRCPRYLDSDL
ncbi:hypothetical protein D9758_010118 [Tetrapyrgos nigripes]|uniref:Heterokaryon incompatibility domain-containing protein n=1 Tax=Tetrapyrgos nigripes TaxID=182062 RepID=A0A8H5CRY3_9AGAR|nr:hypothetical protein D9758_010118 [Tetrapyrgos nigripes]